jgi:hypothetical protein
MTNRRSYFNTYVDNWIERPYGLTRCQPMVSLTDLRFVAAHGLHEG